MATTDPLGDDPLVRAVADYVRDYMGRYDASHDFQHIRRVVGLAHHIYRATAPNAHLDLRVITLAALLHDVGDRKYVRPGDPDPATMAAAALRARGAPDGLAAAVQAVCLGVSYSSEARDPARAAALLAAHPELAVVQDADRLDALGAVGVGRVFAYGAARTERGLAASVDHFDEKLLRLEGMMKTEAGRRLAAERTRRLRAFQEWWREEVKFAEEAPVG